MSKIFPLVLLMALGLATSGQAQDRMLPTQKGAVQIKSGQDPAQNKPYIVVLVGEKSYPVPADSLNSIDPNSIISVNVLKDKSATSLYGEKGKNGVVQIQLKPEQEKAFLQTLQNNNPAPTDSNKPVTIRLDDRPYSERSFPEPLYIIQTKTGEVALRKEDISSLNPDWIKSINVLKGEEAEKRFKEQGKIGVILITLHPEKEQEVLRMLKTN